MSPMDPTTLITFLFKAPPEVRTVELLGSWDNFQRPYYMHHDRRRGTGFWSGCFHFDRIIFDGDKAEWAKPRSGGLKQGGTYWYFFRLNDSVEAFDDAQKYTQGCPLLPGQTVNVIDIPVELKEAPSRRRSATINVAEAEASLQRTHTLDPNDKWAALEPPPVSRVHERCISDLALNGRLETKPHSFREAPASPSISSCPGKRPSHLDIPRKHTADETRSLRPRTGWSSMPASRDSSSIFDAYPESYRDADGASLSAFPIPNAYQTDNRPITRDGGSAYRGFDFAFDGANMRRSMSKTGDEDLDGTSFIESPPQSAYGSVDWRFTAPSAHHDEGGNLDDRERQYHSENPHRRSVDTANEDEASADPASDICSPTFSAATVSSEGGANTPFRLSGAYARSAPSARRASIDAAAFDAPDGVDPDQAVEQLTTRLGQLESEDSAGTLLSTTTDNTYDSGDIHYSPEQRRLRSHYILPEETHSATTLLSKVSSGHASIAPTSQDLPPLPTMMGSLHPGGDETSFTDDIFNELGYLGGSIA